MILSAAVRDRLAFSKPGWNSNYGKAANAVWSPRRSDSALTHEVIKLTGGETLQRGDIVFAAPISTPFLPVLRLPTSPSVHVTPATTVRGRGRVTSLFQDGNVFSKNRSSGDGRRKKSEVPDKIATARGVKWRLIRPPKSRRGEKKAWAGNLVRTGAPCQHHCCNFTLLCNRPTVPLGTTTFRRRGRGAGAGWGNAWAGSRCVRWATQVHVSMS